ncbi:MAG: hypothetical protein EXS12_03620 [Phycisphaerales bacterium]|nr:hypothetical protein [Phycisphaerales bacterium]
MQEVSIDAAIEFLHGHLCGFLKFDGERVGLKFIVASDGTLVMPVMEAMLLAMETVLELPNDDDDSMHLIVTLSRQSETGTFAQWCDRWRAYHGEPEDVRWATVAIDSGRLAGWFLDDQAMMKTNALAAEESALLKQFNAKPRVLLKSLCVTNKVDCDDPIAVGVDAGGIDIRRKHDVARLSFTLPMTSAAQVRSFIEGASFPSNT